MRIWYEWDFKQDERLRVPIDRLKIMELVCIEFECTIEQLRSDDRKRNPSDARKVYSYLTRKHFNDTHHRIAKELNCNHSNVTNQLKRIEEYIQAGDLIVNKIRRIEYNFFNHKTPINKMKTETAVLKMSKQERDTALKLMKKYVAATNARKELLEAIADDLKSEETKMKEAQADLIALGEKYKALFDADGRFDLEEGYLLISKTTIIETKKKFSLGEFYSVHPEMMNLTLKTAPIKKAFLDKDMRKELILLGVNVNTEDSIQVKSYKQPDED